MSQKFTGLTAKQIKYVNDNYSLQVNVPQTPNQYGDPVQNVIDRNIQEQLLRDNSNYNWGKDDKKSFKKNCGFGAHNFPLGTR